MSRILLHHPSGSTEVLTHISSKHREKSRKITTAVATTDRVSAANASLTINEDEVEIEDDAGSTAFRGILTDIRRDASTVTLTVESFVKLAKDAGPSAGKQPTAGNTDRQVVLDAIDSVPELSRGTVETVEPDVDVIFHHASPALQIRLMRDLSQAYVSYNPDKTVDYTQSIGSNRTGTTISPDNQNLTASRVKRKGGQDKKTHLRVIGGGSTHADVVANSYNSGDREQWGRAVFQAVADKTMLRRYGEALLDELSTEWKEIEATITELSPKPDLGDTFTVDYPQRDINSDVLEVVEVTTVRDRSGIHYETVLSNRSFTREQAFETDQFRQTQTTMTGQTSVTKNVPSVGFPKFELPANKYIDHQTILERGTRLYLWKTTQSPADLDVAVKLIDRPGSVALEKYSEATLSYDVGSPLATIDASDDGRRIAFRVDNTSSDDVETSAEFYYTIETVN